MDILSIVGTNIRFLRREKDLTIEQLAERSGISSKYLQRVEVGKRNISIKNLYKVANGLETSLEKLVRPPSEDEPGEKIGVIAERLKMFSKNQLDIISQMLDHIDERNPAEKKQNPKKND